MVQEQPNKFIGAEKSHDELNPDVEVNREAIKAIQRVKRSFVKMYNKLSLKQAV